jgi:pimeloyl-ACP methyl ester carboxylesterase
VNKVYFISGLCADKRAFSFLNLSFCEPVFINWIQPLKNESLSAYALRLKEQIRDDNPIIVGVSFGGMLATEMAK